MPYPLVELNGWDYVVAMTQRQVNLGLGLLYADDTLPRKFSQKHDVLGVTVTAEGTLGQPTLAAVKDGLKLCELTIPITGGTIRSPAGDKPIPAGGALKVKTSLNSVQASVSEASESLYDVFVDLKDDDAVYAVTLDGLQDDEVSLLQDVLRKELLGLTGHPYKVATFPVMAGVDEFLPRLIDFSFQLNPSDAERSAFLLCGAMDGEGPQVENRLVFSAEVLPSNLPAALWMGRAHTLGHLLLPIVASGVSEHFAGVELAYDAASGIVLPAATPISLPDDDHDAKMTAFSMVPRGGQLAVRIDIEVYDITIFNYDAKAWAEAEISLDLTPERSSIVSSSRIVDQAVETSGAAKILKWFVPFLSEVLIVLELVIKGKIGAATAVGLDGQLQAGMSKFNESATLIPALQNLAVGGHLVFESIGLYDTGDVCIGISDTARG